MRERASAAGVAEEKEGDVRYAEQRETRIEHIAQKAREQEEKPSRDGVFSGIEQVVADL